MTPDASDKVFNLKGESVTVLPDLPDYNLALVEMFERAIAGVKAGTVSGAAIVLLVPPSDDNQQTEQIDVSWQGGRLTLLAAASRLVFRLNLALDETTEIP